MSKNAEDFLWLQFLASEYEMDGDAEHGARFRRIATALKSKDDMEKDFIARGVVIVAEIAALRKAKRELFLALAELCELKAMKDMPNLRDEYERRKPAAWDTAFDLVDAYVRSVVMTKPSDSASNPGTEQIKDKP